MRLIVGELNAGDDCIQTPERIQFLRDHWKEIGDCSGQPFKFNMKDGIMKRSAAVGPLSQCAN